MRWEGTTPSMPGAGTIRSSEEKVTTPSREAPVPIGSSGRAGTNCSPEVPAPTSSREMGAMIASAPGTGCRATTASTGVPAWTGAPPTRATSSPAVPEAAGGWARGSGRLLPEAAGDLGPGHPPHADDVRGVAKGQGLALGPGHDLVGGGAHQLGQSVVHP